MKKKDWFYPIFVIILLFCAEIFILFPVRVDGPSMNSTLHTGDMGIVLRQKKPERFDLVTFESHDSEEKIYIKRVIGLPGDHVVYKSGQLIINEKEYTEPYLDPTVSMYGQNIKENFDVKVPDDAYYVLGDNRGNSKDSRIFGSVKKEDIDGVFVWRFWPLNKMKTF